MSDTYIKTGLENNLTKTEIAFVMIFFALSKIENHEIKKILIEAMAMLASDK